MTVTLAHLSDPHLPLPPGGPPLSALNVKQMLALASWRRRRRLVTSRAVLDGLREELLRFAPDHIAVTGDLINLAWAPEFGAARDWLASLGTPERVSVVPGNHDLTRAIPWAGGIGQWAPFMAGDAEGPPLADAVFPFLRRCGEVAVIGLSSAMPTRLFSAAGRVGLPQMDRAESLLAEAAASGMFRVVLIHHPPVAGPGGHRKALQDRDALCRMLARCGAELVLHGHHHEARLVSSPGPSGPIPVIGVASASSRGKGSEPATWHLHRIERDDPGWWLTTTTRRWNRSSGTFHQAGEWRLRLEPSVGPHGLNSAAL